jgi:hypothetical protein
MATGRIRGSQPDTQAAEPPDRPWEEECYRLGCAVAYEGWRRQVAQVATEAFTRCSSFCVTP